MKGPRLQPPVFAFTHHLLHVLLDDLEILQQRPFKLIAPLGILGHVLYPLERQPDMAFLDRFAK
jgi:hypothetical protein